MAITLSCIYVLQYSFTFAPNRIINEDGISVMYHYISVTSRITVGGMMNCFDNNYLETIIEVRTFFRLVIYFFSCVLLIVIHQVINKNHMLL